MSLINEVLNKSRTDTQIPAYKSKKDIKRQNSFLSLFILVIILALSIGFYYVSNFTNLIPQFSSGKEVKIRLKEDMDFTSYAKVSKEAAPAPESIKDTARLEEASKVEDPPSFGRDVVTTVAQVQTSPPQVDVELVPTAEVQTVQSFEASKEGKIEQEVGAIRELPLQDNNAWYADYHFGMGVFYQKDKEIDKAIEEYNKVIELNPDNAEVHINLGVIYRDRRDLDKAVEEYEKALAIDPNLEMGHNNLGVVYFIKGNYAEAIRHYQKAIEINPKNLESYANLGIAYGAQKRIDEAISAFQTAISIDPRHAETQYNLAVTYDENGEIKRAVFHYSKFLELSHAVQSELVDRVKRRIDVLLNK